MSTSSTTIGILVEPRYLPEQSSPGDRLYTFAYTITVTNNGPSPAPGVTLSDALPAGLSFIGATASNGTTPTASGNWALRPIAFVSPAP